MSNLVWFRADLRLHDHPALAAACANKAYVRVVFIKTPKTWASHDDALCKIEWILKQVERLQKQLALQNISLDVLECPDYKAVPKLIAKYCQQWQIKNLFFNCQYEVNEVERDQQVEAHLNSLGVAVKRFHDQLLVEPGLILSGKSEPLKVFTAFKNRWLAYVAQHLDLEEAELPVAWDQDNPAFPVLTAFLDEQIPHYAKERDFPALPGTSQLSPYLAQGVLSIKRVWRCLAAIPDSVGKTTWQNELIWREFFKHILSLFPAVSRHQAFNPAYDGPWQNNQRLFQAWCEGKTGFPLIDAAMRQLNQTGWMHNRLRMNVAMFLTKLLNIDWRWGERYFMQHLLDGDLAPNNGGWQWAAGTGCDAAPYFRIFNPILQSEKFDPKGEFIRQYCPELQDFDAKTIHAPHARNALLAAAVGYPAPVLDYQKARQATLQKYQKA